ncbi:MAG: PleD family two-component system response regulator, partial [Spartobacteria bacterium]
MNRTDDPAGQPIALHGRVLVACEDPGDLEILAKHLERQGLEVHSAPDGLAAREMVKSTAFDLVFLGASNPALGGQETLVKMNETPATRHIPVIIVTRADGIDEAIRGIEAGADDHLPKPFHPVLLRARVMTCLEKKALGEAGLRHL